MKQIISILLAYVLLFAVSPSYGQMMDHTDLKLTGLTQVYRVLKPGGRLLAVDIYRPVNLLWWIIAWVLYFSKFTRDHIAGRLPYYFRKTGFHQIENVGRWKGLLSFWLAYKADQKIYLDIEN